MTCRTESNQVWVHEYNAENRISAVHKMDGTDCSSQGSATHTWIYTYDGDGVRVKEVYLVGAVVTMTKYYFAGGAYEIQDDGSTQTTLKYYSIAGMMVAMDNGTDLVYFANDHLRSTSIVMNTSGGLESQNRYLPFGQVRDNISDSPIEETDFGYTGQRNLASIGLMDYNARFYSPTLIRFIQPDTIVGNPSNPQSLNRYSYVHNSPIMFVDPLGLYSTCGTRENPRCSQPGPHDPTPGGGGNDGGNGDPGDINNDIEDLKEKASQMNKIDLMKALTEFDVTVMWFWDVDQIAAIYVAIMLVSTEFSTSLGMSAQESFTQVYGNSFLVSDAWNGDSWAWTYDSNHISFRGFYSNFDKMINNMLHELV